MLRRIVLSGLGFAFVALATFGAGAAEAQNQYERQVRGYLASSGNRLLGNRGFNETGRIYTGSLADGDTEDVWITLDAGGSYAVIAVCDEDCSDIDLFLYDETGDEIDMDTSIDDEPIVEVSPSYTQDYRVGVRMYNCDIEPCYYAVGIYERGGRDLGGGRRFGGNRVGAAGCAGGDYTLQACASLERAFADRLGGRGYVQEDDIIESSLADGEDESFWFSLRRNESYAFLAACDRDCEDIDLFVYDEDGNEVESDVSLDAVPTIRFTARYTGDYRVRVNMYTCTAEPCYYVVGFYSR